MTRLLTLATCLSALACQNIKPEDVERLKKEAVGYEMSAAAAESRLKQLKNEQQLALQSLEETSICKRDKVPAYVLGLKLKQSRISLDIGAHLKDAANAVEFELPVSKALYDQMKVGGELLDEFRVGSLWLRGSFSSWKVTVTSKRIESMEPAE